MSAPLGRLNATGPSALAEYSFRQRFRVPADWAFRWCTDFTPDDWKYSAVLERPGSRKVTRLSPRTILLDDRFPGARGRPVRKLKLVQIFPRTRSWVSTHLVGPNHYSQFWYYISPAGEGSSRILFVGRELRWEGQSLAPASAAKLTAGIRSEDAQLWKRFASEMEREFHQVAPRMGRGAAKDARSESARAS